MIEYDVADGVAHIRFNRPTKHNALTEAGVADLLATLHRFDMDDSAKVGIISGEGPSFCSGADVGSRLVEAADSGAESLVGPTEADVILWCVNWKPLIAAVHGYVLGHGLQVALLCDMILASDMATFQVTETKIGIPSNAAWTQIKSLTGSAQFANDVTFTGRMFSAEEAQSAGLLTKLVKEGEHLSEAELLAQQLLENPQGSLRELIRLRRSVLAEDLLRARHIVGIYRFDLTPEYRQVVEAKAAKGTASR
jgi:enoyl-CoA hydratase/carnithine racemase